MTEPSDMATSAEGAAARPDPAAPEHLASAPTEVLTRARAAFDAGDYGLARELLRSATSDDEVAEARELERRMSPDPMQYVLLAGCLALILWIANHYL